MGLMSAIYSETHFKGRLRSVAELFFQHCIGEGIRHADVKEAGLDQISKDLNGPILVDGEPLDTEVESEVLLVTPTDRSGWCVAYGSGHQLGESLIELLGRPCPIEDGARTWDGYLGIEAAIHGYVNQKTHGWGWLFRRGGAQSGYSRASTLDAPPGKDLSNAFAEIGRLFGSINLDLALHRLLNLSRPDDLERHKLLWAERPASAA
jgi:hypothetical protein